MDEIKVIVENRKARHDYHIDEVIEAGLVLQGTEVKSIRGRRVNLKDSFARVENDEVFRITCISPYEQGNRLITTHCAPANSSFIAAKSAASSVSSGRRG